MVGYCTNQNLLVDRQSGFRGDWETGKVCDIIKLLTLN